MSSKYQFFVLGLLLVSIITIIYLVVKRDTFDYENTFVHPPWNVSDLTRDSVKSILEKIIVKVNEATGSKYYLLTLENVSSYPYPSDTPNLPCGMIPYQIIVDFFVHDTENKITKRLITKLRACPCKNKITVESINVSNGKEISMDLPLSTATADPYLIQTDENTRRIYTDFLKGVENISLEYSDYKEDVRGRKIPLMGEYQATILPPNILNSIGDPMANFPCRRISNCWDNNGVNYMKQGETPTCQGINNSYWKRFPYIYDNPSVLKGITTDGDKQAYLWTMGAQNVSGARMRLADF